MKFVTRKTIKDSVNLQNTVDDFLKTVKLIEQFGSENVFNFDQNDFQLEIHSERSLSDEEIRKIESVVQYVNNTPLICFFTDFCTTFFHRVI